MLVSVACSKFLTPIENQPAEEQTIHWNNLDCVFQEANQALSLT